MTSLSYQLGHSLGTILRTAITTFRSLDPAATGHRPTAPMADWLELSQTPAIMRKGVNLNQWYEKNVTLIKPLPAREPVKKRRLSLRERLRASPKLLRERRKVAIRFMRQQINAIPDVLPAQIKAAPELVRPRSSTASRSLRLLRNAPRRPLRQKREVGGKRSSLDVPF